MLYKNLKWNKSFWKEKIHKQRMWSSSIIIVCYFVIFFSFLSLWILSFPDFFLYNKEDVKNNLFNISSSLAFNS